VFFYKIFITNNSSSSSIRSRTALKLGEWLQNSLRIHNFFESVFILELAVRIVDTMKVIFPSNLSKMFFLGAILSHVLNTCLSKERRDHFLRVRSVYFYVEILVDSNGRNPISSKYIHFYHSFVHLLKAKSDHTVL